LGELIVVVAKSENEMAGVPNEQAQFIAQRDENMPKEQR
jgi:hypothetical protein